MIDQETKKKIEIAKEKTEELKEILRKKIEEAKQRQQDRMITLRQLLVAMQPEEPLPDEWVEWDDFRPQSVYKIILCFMAEEETWIEAYRDHVMLIPWYDCKVVGFYAGDEKYTMQVWLAYEDYIKQMLGSNHETNNSLRGEQNE